MPDFEINFSDITVGSDGRISIDGVDAFREARAEGYVPDIYALAASYGSKYGEVGVGYHGNPQSWSGYLSDFYSTHVTDGYFYPGNAVYEGIKNDLAKAYADFVSENQRMPTTDEVFKMHEDVFADYGIPGAWIGTAFPDTVKSQIGTEPWDPKCFPAHTPVTISLTETRPISDIRVGDTVLAFDSSADLGRGALVPRKVVRLYRNTTDEWVKLTWSEDGEQKELVTTPGHHFFDRFGSFPTIEEMLENGKATVVLASGELTEVTAERITYSAQTAHLFEQAQAVGMVAGNTALKPAAIRAGLIGAWNGI
jgi:hypothetical protein